MPSKGSAEWLFDDDKYSSIKNIKAQRKASKADKTQFNLKRASNRQVYFSKETS